MNDPKTDDHVHNADECDDHHGEEPGHVHDPHECDGHEHHSDDDDKELVVAG